jgi:hypothetical protein
LSLPMSANRVRSCRRKERRTLGAAALGMVHTN